MKRRPSAGALCCAALFLFSLLALLFVSLGTTQSASAFHRPVPLLGEYSLDGETWHPLEEDTAFPASAHDVYLRCSPAFPLEEHYSVFFCLDHIFFSLSVNGEEILSFLPPARRYTNDLCGFSWYEWISPGIAPGDLMELHLCSPHRFPVQNGYSTFLNNIYTGHASELSAYLSRLTLPLRTCGMIVVILSLVLLGVALASLLMKVPLGPTLWTLGILSLLMGFRFLLETSAGVMSGPPVAFVTLAEHLCLALVFLLLLCFTQQSLTGAPRRFALALCWAWGAAVAALLAAVLLTAELSACDIGFLWRCLLCLFAPAMLLCCLFSLVFYRRVHLWNTAGCTLLYAAACADLLSFFLGLWTEGLAFSLCFALLFVIYLCSALVTVPANYQAAVQTRRLENELQESRISIMLSQIQPHFLYNTLTSICCLCDEDPGAVKNAITKFSRYLRGNLSSLERKAPVPFDEELRHIRVYLDLEKLRFEDKLTIDYDIRATGFSLPALTIQPIVENAVKHGVGARSGGGTVSVSSWEEESCFVVEVRDNGVGFDPARPPQDNRDHVGVSNVRSRLASMCGGTLQLSSYPGLGTTATVRIPKGGTPL